MTKETYLQASQKDFPSRPSGEDVEAARQWRLEILSRIQGKYVGLPGGSKEFAAQKAEEKAREERHWPDRT